MVEPAEAEVSASIEPQADTYHIGDYLDNDRLRLVLCQVPQRSEHELIS